MEYKKINELLKNLSNAGNNPNLTFIKREDINLGVSGNSYGNDGEGVQGEEDNYYLIYKINDEDNLFLKIEMFTDSYGHNDSPRGAEIVEGKDINTTVFEEVKNIESAEQLKKAVENYISENDGFSNFTYGDVDKVEFGKLFGEWEEVHSEGGHEGGGSHAEKVYHFKKHDVYLKLAGYYSSYDGTDWDDCFTIVKPEKKKQLQCIINN